MRRLLLAADYLAKASIYYALRLASIVYSPQFTFAGSIARLSFC
jgi:hypothetical protein